MQFMLLNSLLIILATVQCAMALECWKCVANNCKDDPDSNYKASKITCVEKGVCMKVEFSMKTNESLGILHSVVRTCSAGPCAPVSREEYKKCLNHHRYYDEGCIRRTCCDDKNLCNGVPSAFISRSIPKSGLLTFVLMYIIQTDSAM